jgi:hypothetical protein
VFDPKQSIAVADLIAVQRHFALLAFAQTRDHLREFDLTITRHTRNTNDLAFTSSDTNVALVEHEVVLPITNGVATIEVKWGEQTASAEVTVTNTHKPFEWSFRNHVQPVLAKWLQFRRLSRGSGGQKRV